MMRRATTLRVVAGIGAMVIGVSAFAAPAFAETGTDDTPQTAAAAPPAPTMFCDVPGEELEIAAVDSLTEGDPVTWKTSMSGTGADTLTGEYVGKIANGLGYDAYGQPRDLLLIDLDAPGIDKTGVWAGASGSPVYDADGKLIGAVSYGFSWEVDTVAGVTPAAVMKQIGELPGHVPTTAGARAAIAEATGETPRGGARQLQPVRITAGGASQTLDTQTARLKKRVPSQRKIAANGLSVAKQPKGMSINGAVDAGEDYPIVDGGNIAVSYGYGAVTEASVGTVTDVCGDEVFAYGHPNSFDNTLRANFHGASAVRIVPDGGFSYKEVTDIGKVKGKITQDRLAGIRGTLGAPHDTVKITTKSTVGSHSSTAVSHISEQWLLPSATWVQTAQDATRMLDDAEVGSATVHWAIDYERANGTQGTLRNTNKYADIMSFPEYVGMDVASDVSAIKANEFETVKLLAVRVSAKFQPDYRASRISGLQLKTAKGWKTLKKKAVVKAVKGKTYTLRAVRSPAPEASNARGYTTFKVRVPKSIKGKMLVNVNGGWGGDFDFDNVEYTGGLGGDSDSFPGLIAELDKNERSDQLEVTSSFSTAKKSYTKQKSVRTPYVMVGGSAAVTFTVAKKR